MSHCCDSSGGDGPRPQRPLFRQDPHTMAQVKDLEAQIAEIDAQRAQCGQEAQELARQEMAGQGTFAAQIHALKQRRMVLTTQAQHLKVRINALLATW
jgi:hypothetical protein